MGVSIFYTIVGAIIGGLVTFYFTRKKFEKEIKENPPINEKMIRAMFLQIVRNPSEAQIPKLNFGYIILLVSYIFLEEGYYERF